MLTKLTFYLKFIENQIMKTKILKKSGGHDAGCACSEYIHIVHIVTNSFTLLFRSDLQTMQHITVFITVDTTCGFTVVFVSPEDRYAKVA